MLKDAFLHSLRKKWYCYFAIVISAGLIVALELLPPMVLKDIINIYLVDMNENLEKILELSILYVVLLILSLLFEFIKQVLLIILGEEFTTEVRKKMALKLKTIPTSYFTQEDSGVLASRFTSDVEQINAFFSDGILSMVIDIVKIIAILIAMFLYSIYLGLITLVAIPVIFIISFTFKKLMLRSQKKSRVMIGYVNNQISETLKNEKMIKIYAKEEYMVGKNKECLDTNYKAQLRVSFFDSIYSPLIQIITALVIVVVVITSSVSEAFGLSIGTIALAIEYITSLFAPIEGVGMEIQSIQKSISGMGRVNEFLNQKDMEPKRDIQSCSFLDEPISVEFDSVSFAYTENHWILKNVSFQVKDKAKISICGRTGVGKTTLFKLIEGDLKANIGDVRINGVPTNELPDEIKHRIFGYVSQSYSPLRQESILTNITMKNSTITREDGIRALKTVGLYDVVDRLPNGIDSIYKDVSFSHGEEQLLNIARAIAFNPKILLLDEMTSGLDSLTEQKIMKGIEQASVGRMIIQISHRLSTTMDSDEIIYLEDGEVKSILTPMEFMKESWAKNMLVLEQGWKK